MSESDSEYLLKNIKIISDFGQGDYTKPRPYVKTFMRKVGVIVDYSNSHGLCFGVVFPNTSGSSGRSESLEIFWFEPEEVDFV